MKAIVCHKYGPPDDILERQDIGKPTVKDKEVLV
jgi:NADPH:quinone reductase-like Zn-dependent oxidoreductase